MKTLHSCEKSTEHTVLTRLVFDDAMPNVIAPEGLSIARQKYLFSEIRECCTPQTRDLVCPKPLESGGKIL